MIQEGNNKDSIRAQEKYLINQHSEIDLRENTAWTRRLKSFPALHNKNYRIYFAGQFISVVGTWLQIVAQGWLVLQLTGSAFLVGLVAALATAPSLLFSLFGGVIVDRWRKKRILFFTQAASMVLALSLGTLVIVEVVTVTIICVFAFMMGTVNALDAPARQSFVSTLVNKNQLASAIALNSGIFNAARAIGPGIAGLLIASVGSGVAFILNGISYVAVITALVFIKIEENPSQRIVKPFHAIRDGIRYSISHPVIRVLMIFTAVLSVFAWPYSTMMPVIARTVYDLDAQGLGYLYSATGLGALVATYLVGKYANKVSPIIFISAGNVLFAASQLIFGLNTSPVLALVLLLLTGLGLLSQTAMINTLIQGMVRNDFRGRVMSIYILMFVGLAPLGNFFIGYMTETFGISVAIISNAITVLTFGLVVYTYKRKIRMAYRHYKKQNQAATLTGANGVNS